MRVFEFVPQPSPPTESALRGTQEPQQSGVLLSTRPLQADDRDLLAE